MTSGTSATADTRVRASNCPSEGDNPQPVRNGHDLRCRGVLIRESYSLRAVSMVFPFLVWFLHPSDAHPATESVDCRLLMERMLLQCIGACSQYLAHRDRAL